MEQQSVPKQARGGVHPIGIAARYNGLSTSVIRAWERRYKAVVPRAHPYRRRRRKMTTRWSWF